MRIRTRYFILFLIISFCLGYINGCIWPILPLPYILNDDTVSKYEHYSLFAGIFGVMATVATIIVALFKDDIIGCFKSVKFNFSLPEGDLIEHRNGNDYPLKYDNFILIENHGNVYAQNCECQIDSLKFIGRTDVKETGIPVNKHYIKFLDEQTTNIPINGKKSMTIFEINSTELPDGKKAVQFRIGENDMIVPYQGGTWICTCSFNAYNTRPITKDIEIKWDGKWHDIKTDMQLTTKIM